MPGHTNKHKPAMQGGNVSKKPASAHPAHGGGSKTKKAVNMTTARCMKCKKMIVAADSKIVNTKRRGSHVGKMLKGTCPVCHTKVCKIVG
uniref:DUF5679 domain-containing protein n=1 Tax=viral metagenome TaxID=1070528 RepID=A0A6C0HLM0_9ZZZZ